MNRLLDSLLWLLTPTKTYCDVDQSYGCFTIVKVKYRKGRVKVVDVVRGTWK